MRRTDNSVNDDNGGVVDNEEAGNVNAEENITIINGESFQTSYDANEKEVLKCSISTSVNRSKVGYFAMYTGFAVSPYYGLFLVSKGFSPFAVGAIVAFMPLCVFLLLPPLSYIADRYHCALKIQLTAAIGSSMLLMLATFFSSSYFIGFFIILHFVVRTPLGPFMDQRTMSVLPPESKAEWGSMRSYGAYGWAFGAICCSVIIDYCGWYTIGCFYTFGIAVSTCIALFVVPHDKPRSATMNYWEILRYVASHMRLVLFMCVLCIMGVGYSIINTFLFIFLRSINAPNVLFGLSVIMTVVVEIPLFQHSKCIHTNLGDRQLLCLAMWAWVLRVISYSFLRNPWLVLFIEPLHGLTFGLMWLSGIHFVRQAFPSWLSHFSIGFLSATSFGFGPLIGNIVGGSLYQSLGGRWMFRVMAIFMFFASIVFLTLDRYLDHLGYKVGAIDEEATVSIDSFTLENIIVGTNENNKKEDE